MRIVRGFSLIELAIAIAIATVLSLVALSGINHYFWRQSVNEVESETRLILDALDDYYHAHCQDSPFTAPTISLLKVNGLLPSGFNPDNQIGSNYVVAINRSLTPARAFVRLTVSAEYNPGFIKNRLNAESVSGRVVSWEKRLWQSRFNEGSMQTDFMRFFGETC